MPLILKYRIHYIIFGALFFIFWFLFKVGGNPNIDDALLSTAVDVVVSMAVLLTTTEALVPKVIYRHRYGIFALLFIALVVVGGTAIIFTQLRLNNTSLTEYHANVARSPKHFYYWFWADLIFGSYILVFFISATGAAIRFAFDRMQAASAVEKLQKEKLAAELDLLKNQVNPHFLFNALNTIFYKIDRENQPARETLERFSKMLRYQLYECNAMYVAIEKELEFLSSYILLQKERLNENYEVTFSGFDDIAHLEISPFLLMPVIENCFKHVSRHDNTQNIIAIDCRAEGNIFTLHTRNTAGNNKITGSTGIGLDNVRKRLKLMYANKYTLEIKNEYGMFEVWLKIVLT